MLQAAFSKKIAIPSVHIIGDADVVVTPAASERLAQVFQAPALFLRHSRGHAVAKLPKEAEAALADFLEARVAEAVAGTPLAKF